MKKIFIQLLVCLMVFSLALNVVAYKYAPPYDDVDGGRLEQNMPEPFSVDSFEKILVASCDFDSAAYSSSLGISYGDTYWSSDDGAYLIEKNDTSNEKAFALYYTSANGFSAGEMYAFTCEIKTVGIKGSAPYNVLAARSTKWLADSHSYDGKENVSGSNDWYEMKQVLEIPEGTAFLRLECKAPKNLTGKVYFDNFKLYKISLDPLESVLIYPNYKGLIFGDEYSDINLDVTVEDSGEFYDTEDMYVEVSLVDENDSVIYLSEADNVHSKMNFVFPTKGLSEGDYYLKTVLKESSSGDVISQKEHTIRKRSEDYRPSAYVDENGHYIKNGDKTFLKRIFNHSTNNGQYSWYQASSEFAALVGIDTVSNYGTWWAVENPNAAALDFIRSNSLTTHIGLSSYWYSDRSTNDGKTFISQQSDILPFFRAIANDYKNNELLEGYYVFDEPNPLIVGEEIRWNNEILADADINHPTFGVADKEYDEYGIYTKMTDILGIDPYPVLGKTDSNGISTDDIAKIGRSVREIKKNFPDRPVYYVMQGYINSNEGGTRSPNYAELRNMAWQAICEGAEGLDWYSYPSMRTDTTKTLEQWTSEVTSLIAEVDSYKNVILSDEPAPLYTVSGGGDWLNLSVKRYNGKTYLFAVNNTDTAKSATVNINGIGNLELSFGRLGVVLQDFEQEDYSSPEAELKSLGFSNGTEIFEVAEDSTERILYVPENSGVINYTAKISDGATLVIGGKEMPLTGKITVRNADSFTVKVIAEDGVTATYMRYRVVKR